MYRRWAEIPTRLNPVLAETAEAVFEEEGVDSAFWFTFAGYNTAYDPDPRRDLDMASYGVVRLLKDGGSEPKAGGSEPKEVYHALAAAYSGGRAAAAT